MRVLLLVSAVAALASCTRAPEEPAPATTTASVARAAAPPPPASTSAAAAAPRILELPAADAAAQVARCIVPSPAKPPPPAKAAIHCPADPLGGPPFAKMGRVSFPSASVEVELALSEDEVTRGLMYRTQMPEEHGMIFRLEERKEQTFWMHNTCISLDMMFIDEDGTIVGILENVPTLNDEARTVGCPSLYVLEVNGGWSRRHGVSAGQKAVIPKMP